MKRGKIKSEEVISFILSTKRTSLPLALFFLLLKDEEKKKLSSLPFYDLLTKLCDEQINPNPLSQLSPEESSYIYSVFCYYTGLYNISPSLASPSLILCSRDIKLASLQELDSSLCIEHDLLENVIFEEKEIEVLLKRVKHLSSSAPIYFREVASPYYKEFLEGNLYYSQAQKFAFYQVINLEKDPLNYNLDLFCRELRNYLLGFPPEQVISTRNILVENIEEYAQLVRERNIANSPRTNYLGETLIYSNEENTLCQDVFSYSPQDILYFINGKHCFVFTRPEFQILIDKRKNFYTNEDLPAFLLTDLSCKEIFYILSVDKTVPLSGHPVKEMLKAVENL